MARGLSPAAVVDAAAELADSSGLDDLTLGAVAARLGVRTPSLYNHVPGLPGLRRGLALRGMRELGEQLRDAVGGLAGEEALVALAAAYRGYARARPGLYQALQRAPDPGDAELLAAAESALRPLLAVLRGFRVEGDAAIHAARTVRSALHGFAELERVGGFGIELDLDRSHRFMVAALAAGLRGRTTA